MHNCPNAMTRATWTDGQHGRRASPSYRYRGQDLSSHERHAIVAALKSPGGNIRLAARQLYVSRGGLYNKMSRFGLNAADFFAVHKCGRGLAPDSRRYLHNVGSTLKARRIGLSW
ncbi:hypothetical protein GCM10009086_26060 [Pseudomonas rhodesiae]